MFTFSRAFGTPRFVNVFPYLCLALTFVSVRATCQCVYTDPRTGNPLFREDKFSPAITGARQDQGAMKIVTMGDSVMWGNGEQRDHKFVSLVAQALANALKRNVVVHAYAHSGARLLTYEPGALLLPTGDDGEPLSDLNAERPTSSEQEVCASSSDDRNADLVLVDGCINDVGATSIALPPLPFINQTSTAKIRADVYKYCPVPMQKLLDAITRDFPKARVVALNYFRIVSSQSNPFGVTSERDPLLKEERDRHEAELAKEVAVVDCSTGDIENCNKGRTSAEYSRKRLQRWQDNSDQFLRDTKSCLAWAVSCYGRNDISCKLPDSPPDDLARAACPAVAPRNSGQADPTVVLATVPDDPEYSYGAPMKRVWSVPLPGDRQDEMYEERLSLCTHALPGDMWCLENPTAHPNVEGAQAYRDAILHVLQVPSM